MQQTKEIDATNEYGSDVLLLPRSVVMQVLFFQKTDASAVL